MRFIIAALIVSLFFPASVFAQSQTSDSVTITTYYPSPYGVYGRLQTRRLAVGDVNGDGRMSDADQPTVDGQLAVNRSVYYVPQGQLPNNAREGELMYNRDVHQFYFRNDSGWFPLGAAEKPQESLYQGTHTVKECTDQGGVVVPNDGTGKICRMVALKCPKLWSQYKDFSKTSPKTCGSSFPGCGIWTTSECTTGSHVWQNKPPETCSYKACKTIQLPEGHEDYTIEWRVCTATITEIGCY